MMGEPFRRYAKYYDLMNSDKSYAREATYIRARLNMVCPGLTAVLELGSGTGRHGRLLAAHGVHVRGIERSPEMVEIARCGSAASPGSFECSVGDIRSVRLSRHFNAVIALFHVMSYQTSNADFSATLETAAYHLPPGGLFLFDVWHGPAVLAQKLDVREKSAVTGNLHLVRKSTPELLPLDNIVVVNFEFTCTDSWSGRQHRFSERHAMRYFFPEEISAATAQRFNILAAEEMSTAARPSEDTWSVTYLLQRRA